MKVCTYLATGALLWPMGSAGFWSAAGIRRILYCRESTAPELVCLAPAAKSNVLL